MGSVGVIGWDHPACKDRGYMILLQSTMDIINSYTNLRIGDNCTDIAETLAEIADLDEQKKRLPLHNRKIMLQLITDSANLIECNNVNLSWVKKAINNKYSNKHKLPEFITDLEFVKRNIECKNMVLKEKFYEYILPSQRQTIEQIKLTGGIGVINPHFAASVDKMPLDEIKKLYNRKIKELYEKIIGEMRIAYEENVLLCDILHHFTTDISLCFYMEKKIALLEE